jgi:hypothetical protein
MKPTKAQLIAEMDHCFDMVWYARTYPKLDNPEKIDLLPEDIKQGMFDNLDRIENTYDEEDLYDVCAYPQILGRWEGKMAGIRFALGQIDGLMDT